MSYRKWGTDHEESSAEIFAQLAIAVLVFAAPIAALIWWLWLTPTLRLYKT